jgi:hypothetical protein
MATSSLTCRFFDFVRRMGALRRAAEWAGAVGADGEDGVGATVVQIVRPLPDAPFRTPLAPIADGSGPQPADCAIDPLYAGPMRNRHTGPASFHGSNPDI